MKKRLLIIICILLVLSSITIIIVSQKTKKEDSVAYDDGITYIDPNTIILNDSGAKVSFSEVILSQPEETRKLIVFTQKATVGANIEKDKIKNIEFEFLKQRQKVTYTANGNFVVDLDKLTENSIKDDADNKILTIIIDHPYLDSIEIDPQKIIVGDQENGKLAFGDMALTINDYVSLETELQFNLKNALNTANNGQEADDRALRMVKKIYEPVVKAVDKEYTVEVKFR